MFTQTIYLINVFSKLALTWATGLLDQAIGDSQMASVINVVMWTKGNYSPFWDVINKSLDITKPMGFAFIVIFFLVHMFDAAAKEQITVDSVIKTLIQLIVAVALIGNMNVIINTLLNIGESATATLAGAVALVDAEGKPIGIQSSSIDCAKLVETWHDSGKDLAGTIFFQSLLIWIIHQVAIIAVDFAAITRVIEIGWRIIFAPIAFANCFEGGANSGAIKYLKTLAALILAAVGLWAVCAAGFSLVGVYLVSNAMSGELLLAQAALLATAGAAVGLSNKIKDVFG